MTVRLSLAIVILSVLLAACGPTAARQGRRGNDLQEDEQYEEAVTAYEDGIRLLEETADDEPAGLRSGLWNNLGAAYYRQDAYSTADSAFRQARATARADEALIRAEYNMGNAAYRRDEPESALSHYRLTLLSDPNHDDARYNYEFVRRNQDEQEQQDQNQQQDQQQENIEPSDYAQQLKEQADALVQQQRYSDAHRLMVQGQKVDRTVEAYRTFTQRLGEVVDIDSAPDSTAFFSF